MIQGKNKQQLNGIGDGYMIKVYEKENVVCIEGFLKETRSKVFMYVVDGMLIDTGAEKMQSALDEVLEDYTVDQVVLTHHHEDHTGNAAWIQQHQQIPFFIHPLGLETVQRDGDYPEYRRQTWGSRTAFKVQSLPKQIRSRNLAWQVIYTPGHADDHVALFHEATGRLFSGDLFVSPKTKVIMKGESIPLIMVSLRKLLALPIQSLFCSHAGYLENGRVLLEEKLAYLENMQRDVLQLYKEGKSVEEINRQLFPEPYPIIAISSGEWDSIHMVTSVIAAYEANKIVW